MKTLHLLAAIPKWVLNLIVTVIEVVLSEIRRKKDNKDES